MTKKNFFNVCFLLLVVFLTLYSVFYGEDLGQICVYLREGDIRLWILGVITVIIFIECESVIIYYLLKTLGEKVKLTHCFLFSFAGFFFSLITPSATGGQPAQLYFMKKDKLSLTVSTLVLMVVTITYKFVLVVIGLFIFIVRPPKVMRYLAPAAGWCYLGIVLNVICVSAMLLLVFHPMLAENICVLCLNTACKMIGVFRKKSSFVKKKDTYLEKIHVSMEKYRKVAEYFAAHKAVILNVFLITFIQRVLLFAVTYIVFISFELKNFDAFTVISLQGMISVAVDMLPLPGGLGISEKLFMDIFTDICGSKYTLPVMIVSRGLTYYTQLLISAVMTGYAYWSMVYKKERINK